MKEKTGVGVYPENAADLYVDTWLALKQEVSLAPFRYFAGNQAKQTRTALSLDFDLDFLLSSPSIQAVKGSCVIFTQRDLSDRIQDRALVLVDSHASDCSGNCSEAVKHNGASSHFANRGIPVPLYDKFDYFWSKSLKD